MKTSTRPIRSRLDQAVPDIARVTRLRAVPSSNDASVVTRSALGEEAWPWHMVPPARPLSAEANEATSSAVPGAELYHEAHRRRAQFFGGLIAAGMGAIFAAALKVGRWYRQSRQASATYAALHQLDDRSLRDLGFTRDEIRSVAAEMAWQTEHSRRLARPTFPARPSLFELFLKQ
jgi:uncharacterized protein YjiS (DUF1127 family)